MTKIEAFRVYFQCSNCGEEWAGEFAEGIRVTTDTWSPNVVVLDGTTIRSMITCPCCKLSEDVVVTEREPIEDG
jgi:transcription elongation factor Elf1